jgi:aminopeptidase N
MRLVRLGLLLSISLGALAALAPRPYDVERYEAHIEPDFAGRKLTGEVTIQFHSIADGLDTLELDAGSLNVSAAVEEFANLRMERRGELLVVHPEKPVRLGEVRRITIRYEAAPASGLSIFDSQAWAGYFTSHWMVCNERADDRAALQLIISAPAGMKVAASGRMVSTHRDGSRSISEWRQDAEVPPFVFGFAVGNFAESSAQEERVKLRFLGPAAGAKDLSKIFRETPSALRFLVDKSGMLYPEKTYTQALLHNGPEQEAAQFTLLPESYGQTLLSKPDDLWLLVHEMAHQWYGIGIACRDWSDFWLSEGLASFLADVYLGEKFGAERYTAEIERAHKNYEQMKAGGKDRPLSFHDWSVPRDAGGRLPYDKGAWVLHLLRQKMGEDAFWRGLRVYTKDNWGRQVTSKEFEKSMEAVTDTPLSEFFQTWVYR